MTRLIEADALFVNLDGMMAVSPTGYIHGDTVADMISDAPTVNAVEVVRCKDCKKNGTSACAMAYWDMETGEITWWNKPDEYCSRAERKDNV